MKRGKRVECRKRIDGIDNLPQQMRKKSVRVVGCVRRNQYI